MARSRLFLATTLVAIHLLTACAGDTSRGVAASPSGDPAWIELYYSTMRADMSDVSEHQASVLEKVAGQGEVTFQDLSESAAHLFDCVESAGLIVDGPTTTQRGGAPFLEFGYGAPTGSPLSGAEVERIISECEQREYFFVSILYMNQPGGTFDERQVIAANADALARCVETYGVALESDATVDEIIAAVTEVLGPQGGGPNCYEEIGLGGE